MQGFVTYWMFLGTEGIRYWKCKILEALQGTLLKVQHMIKYKIYMMKYKITRYYGVYIHGGGDKGLW